MAQLLMNRATRFHGGEASGAKAEQWRTVALSCSAWWEARNAKWEGRVRSGRREVASRRGCDARMRTARGQREQESGDEWQTRGVCFLNRSATAVLKVF